MTRRLRGLTSLLALLALTVGLPWALADTIGNPLRQWSAIRSGDLSDQSVIAILTAVAWIAWATFAVAFAVELLLGIASAVTHRPRVQVRIPLLGVQQDLARTLIAAVLLLGPAVVSAFGPTVSTAFADTATTVSAPAAPRAAVSSAAASPRTGAVAADAAKHTSTTLYRIPEDGSGMRSYWALAEHYLGDGQRWPEIWDLNNGRHQADGSVMDSPQMLRRGWTVVVPTSTTAVGGGDVVTVEQGDTLTQIAEDHHVGEPAVWQRNEGRVMPDGRVFDDADLIKPGDTIIIPGPAVAVPPKQTPTPATPTPGPIDTHPAPKHQPPTNPTSPTPGSPTPSTDAASPSVTSSSPPPPAGTASTDRRDVGGDRSTHSYSENVPLLAAAGAGVLAALSLTALTRRRRRQLRHRRPHHTIPAPPPALRDTERQLRAVAPGSGSPDVGLLDDALRALAATIGADPTGHLFDLIAARLSAEQVCLTLADPAAELPSPWTRHDGDATGVGAIWRLRRDQRPAAPRPIGEQFAPYPTLATVATTDDHQAWLVDLEHVGTLAVTGPAEHRRNLLRYLAAELAHNSWSDHLHVSLYGVGDELAALDPTRLACHHDLSALLRILTAHTNALTAEANTAPDLLTRRLHPEAGDPAAPHVALLNLETVNDDDATALAALLAELSALTDHTPRTGLVVVVATEQPPPSVTTRLHIAPDTTLTASSSGDAPQPLHACGLSADEARDLAALLAVAGDLTDRLTPASRGTAPWERYADVLGAARPEHTQDRPAPSSPPILSADRHRGTVGALSNGSTPPTATTASTPNTEEAPADPTDAPTTGAVLPRNDGHYLTHAATTTDDLRELAPTVPTATTEAIQYADPDLDTDLAAWHDPSGMSPKLHLLGPPTLTGVGNPPAGRGALLTEIVAYLITRPHGATVEQIATDLWPHIPDAAAKTTPRQSVSVARQWLGTEPRTGGDRLPRALPDASGAKLYRVHGVLVDADLFRRLRLRGTTRGPDGIADLRAALDLVGGTPFAHRRPAGYSWLGDTPLDHEYTAMIIDTAHVVATHDLAEDNPAAASAAAQVALQAAPDDDVPLLDLIAANEALGNHAEAQACLRRLLAGHDAEVEEDLPPRTYQLLLQRGWLPD